MADLENLLLEAAGRTNAAGKNRQSFSSSRRRRDGSYSDHGSDSRDDESDDGRGGYSSRKPSGSQVPLKKRFESADRDENQGVGEGDDDYARSDRGGSSDESDVGSDLYKDEDDRRKLAEMTELEREMILLDRATKKDDKEFKDKLRLKRENDKVSSSSQSRKQTPPQSARVRISARSADRAAAKDDALNELRAKRLKQQDPEAHRRLRDASSSRGGGGVKDFSPVKRKPFSTAAATAAPVNHSSQSDSESRSDSEDDGSAADVDSDDDGGLPGGSEKKLKFEDIKEITIRRSKLSKWLMEPFFEELIVGCFVRVGIGMSKTKQSIYRLCMVRNVDASDPDRQYKLENKMTHKYLNVVWGNESSAARWQMAMVSDSPPVAEEFNQWVREVERTGGRMPSKREVLEKKEAIKKINTYVYSAATVKQMLKDKKSATTRPLNVAAEKDRLRKELEVAEYKQNVGEVERIKRRIQELDASREKMKDSKAIKLAEMNRKNRVENFKNASDVRAMNTSGLKAGEAGYDPFSRRWTRSRNYYVSKPPSEEESAAAAAAAGGSAVIASSNAAAAAAATAKALEEAADAGKLIDTRAPVDELGMESNQFHNFELPISLTALHKYGGSHGALAGFMARKQKIEATIGCRVPENDGRRHVLTLTVSDYKRRRGLL